jgi:hypothetical protein
LEIIQLPTQLFQREDEGFNFIGRNLQNDCPPHINDCQNLKYLR